MTAIGRLTAVASPSVTTRKPLRVLQIGKFYAPQRGGMETHLQLLSEELGRSVDVRVLVSSITRRTSHEVIGGIPVTRAGTASTIAGAPICPTMVAAIRSSDADIVHLHLPNPAATLSYFASGHRGPLVLTYHSDVVRQRILARVFEPALRRTLRRSTATIVASPNYVESSTILRDFRDRCRIIPFGIRSEVYEAQGSATTAELRRRHGPRIVLGIGRLVGYKGFDYLLRAMVNVRGHLLLIGDGPLRESLQRTARELGVASRVSFLGNVDDVIPYLQAADVFVLPSVTRNEAFGIVQLEAMACGKPVVNTSLDSGVPFVSVNRDTGLTVPPADSGALAVAINRLLDDDVLRVNYGNAARLRVSRHFTAQAMSRSVIDLYDEVMAMPQGRSRPLQST